MSAVDGIPNLLYKLVHRFSRRPLLLLPLSFLFVVLVGAGLLTLPMAHNEDGVKFVDTLFTATSAVTVTGLTVVDTGTHWTSFGHVVILLLAQLGGFGVMSLATLLALLVNGRLELSSTLVLKAETQASSLDMASGIIKRIAMTMLIGEGIVLLVTFPRLWLTYDRPFFTALWEGLYLAVMSFTNAGFCLYPTGLAPFLGDDFLIWAVCASVFAGSLGFPTLFELARDWRRPRQWTVHTKLTVFGFVVLFVTGFVAFLVFEWANPATIAQAGVPEKINAALMGTVMPRSGGLTVIDYADINDETGVITMVLMFIGGGSAGTSGGLKVTTFFLLFFVLLAEVRGEHDVTIAKRRIPYETQRLALSVALISMFLVVAGTIFMVIITELPLTSVAFDVISAFGTVGLSMGITPGLPASCKFLLMALMFIGRVGTVIFVSSLALKQSASRYRYPVERPIVG